ncbi:MAG: glycosyltransferase family 4 protein [Bacteroides sp.]|nr:glycosyltransferase family 4 protein [Bacteroides sp.]
MKKRIIAYCVPAIYSSGGMERVLAVKANYLIGKGYEVHIVITDGGDRKPYFYFDKSIHIHQLALDFEELYALPIASRWWKYKYRMLVFKRRLNECLCQIRPDITISLLRRDINILHEMSDGSLKIGEVHFDRLHYRHFSVKWLPRFICNIVQQIWMRALIRQLRKLSKFVVLTAEDASCWPELDNVVVIPNPVSFISDRTSSCLQKRVIAAGRYVPQKGFDRLIAAWRIVAEKHPDWKLNVYGDGWLREQLQEQIEALDLSDSCCLEHTVSDIKEKYLDSSLFVLSSRYEGFGLVIVEAMSCGLPVVSFACKCGPRDIISDGKDGLLIPDDDIEKLAEGINWLIEEENVRIQMGNQAFSKSKGYAIDKIGMKWEILFDSLLKEKELRL